MALPVDPARFGAYLGVAVVMVITPGPANLFAIATGARGGRGAVLAGVAGMNSATLVWLTAATLGLGALALAFPAAFRILALGGALYLAWLGARALWTAWRGAADEAHAPKAAPGSAFRSGFMVQILNPKALLYTTVVLPPFLDLHRPLLPQMVLLAGSGLSMDVAVMTAYGFGGAAVAQRMNEPGFRRGFTVFTGVLLILAAGLIALRG